MDYIFRLTYGMDLRKGIEDFCQKNNISSACLVTCVGCVYQANIRLSDGRTIKQYEDRYEIVSLTGTITRDGSHIHISIADGNGIVVGGHLCYNTLVNTTAEVVIRSLDNRYVLKREYDKNTGYNELIVK